MTRRKSKYGIKRGGTAYPLENNVFMLFGNRHEDGGIDIDRTVEAQGGEIMRRFGPDNMQILSKENDFIHGNPVKNYLSGMSFDDAFKLQQIDNVLQGRKNSLNAKYGVETEYDRIMAKHGTNKTSYVERYERNKASRTTSVGQRIKRTAGNIARTIGDVAGYVSSGEIADDAARRVGINTNGAAQRIMSKYWEGMEQSPLGTGMRAFNDAASRIEDDDYRAIATIFPMLVGGGKGMRMAKRGAAGTGGGGRGKTTVQGELQFKETTKPKKPRTPRPAVKSKTGRTILGEILGMTEKAVMERMKQGMSEEPVKFTTEDNSRSVRAAKNYQRQEKARVTREKNKAAEQQRKGVVNTFLSSLTSDLYRNAAKKQIAKAEPIEFTPEVPLSAEDYAYYKELSDKSRRPYQIEARQKRDFERQAILKQKIAEEEIPLKQRAERKSKARALEAEAQKQVDKGPVWVTGYNRPKKVTKKTIIDKRGYETRINLKNVTDPITGKTYNAEDILRATEDNPFAYRINANGKRHIGYNNIESFDEGYTSYHNPYRIYKAMKSKADKNKGTNKNTSTTNNTSTPSQNNTNVDGTTTNNSRINTTKKWGKRIGYGAIGVGGTIGLINAFKPKNQNSGFTNNDNYGVDENLSGRFVTVDPDERDIDTIGSIGNGMHHDSIIGKIYDSNGDTTKLKQISDTTRQDSSRRKKNKYGGNTSLRGSGNNRIKAPWGLDGRWYSTISEKMLADRIYEENNKPNGSAAARKRAGLSTPDVNIDHTNGTGNTSPYLPGQSDVNIPWLSSSSNNGNSNADDINIRKVKATPNGVNYDGVTINYGTGKDVEFENGLKDIDKKWNKHNNAQTIVSATGSLLSLIPEYLQYRNNRNNNPYTNTSIAFEPYVKLKNYYNINPQLSELNEGFGLTSNNIRANTSSSKNVVGRINSANQARIHGINELYGTKYNEETKSLNREAELNMGVRQRNTSSYNDRMLEGAKFNVNATNAFYNGIGDTIQSLADTYKNYSNNRMQYLTDDIRARMILSKYSKYMAQQVAPELLKKYGIEPLLS